MDTLWVEKYRPNTLEGYVFRDDNQKTQETKLIKLSTNMGDITLELFQDKAPETVANFLKYTNEGKLNGTIPQAPTKKI